MTQEQQNQPKFHTKYPSFILGVDALAVREMGMRTDMLEDKPYWWFEDDGGRLAFSDETPNSKLINKHLVIRQRNGLEANPGVLQLLPYTLVGYKNPDDGWTKLTSYYRKKGHGEVRLQGNRSIGWGGHLEVIDLMWTEEGDLDLKLTILTNLLRELEEECIFIDTQTGEEVSVHSLATAETLSFRGFIYDTRNEVGSCHLAIVHHLLLPDHIQVKKRENEHLDGPVMTLNQLVEEITEFEPWSEIIINDHFQRREAVAENLEAHQNQVQEAQYHRLAASAGQVNEPVAPSTLVQESVLEGTLPALNAAAAAQADAQA
jgi:predicted NUDIX family phosphoesterase